jgi:competence protein ComFC
MILELIKDFIFPPVCLHCMKRLDDINKRDAICEKCFSTIKINNSLTCGKCYLRLAEGRRICHKDFPYILGAAASYDDETVKDLIHGLKFNFIKDASKPLAKLLINYVAVLPIVSGEWEVVPVPLGKRRERQRGFNQSKLIAELFAEHFNLSINDYSLVRFKNTKPQSEVKGVNKRYENVSDAFRVESTREVSGKNIILIDDVTTSGATFVSAALALRDAGVRRIIALAMAKV